MVKGIPIVLPEEFMVYLDTIVARKEYGFQSREEVAKAAIRDYFDKVVGKWFDFGFAKGQQALTNTLQVKDPIKKNIKVNFEKNRKNPQIKANIPPKPLEKSESQPVGGKMQVTEKIKADFKAKMVQLIHQQKQFPLLLLDLKIDVSKAIGITETTKPYTGKFSQYVQAVIDEYNLPVTIDPPNLIKKV